MSRSIAYEEIDDRDGLQVIGRLYDQSIVDDLRGNGRVVVLALVVRLAQDRQLQRMRALCQTFNQAQGLTSRGSYEGHVDVGVFQQSKFTSQRRLCRIGAERTSWWRRAFRTRRLCRY